MSRLDGNALVVKEILRYGEIEFSFNSTPQSRHGVAFVGPARIAEGSMATGLALPYDIHTPRKGFGWANKSRVVCKI